MSRALEPAIHAPGYELAHCLPPAGVGRPQDLDVYRYNRVVPMYTPDPCIGPSDGQLICPPVCGSEKRNELMCPSGIQHPNSDSFQFYDSRRSTPEANLSCSCPHLAHSAPCTSLGAITDLQQCPGVNRPPTLHSEPGGQGGHFHKSFPPQHAPQMFAGAPVFQQQQPRPAGQFSVGGGGVGVGGAGFGGSGFGGSGFGVGGGGGGGGIGVGIVGGGGCASCCRGGIGVGLPCYGCGVYGGGVGPGVGPYDYYVNNKPIDASILRKIPLCEVMNPPSMGHRHGATAPTPHAMMRRGGGGGGGHGMERRRAAIGGRSRGGGGGGEGMRNGKIVNIGGPGNCASHHCQNPYYASNYLCRPVFDRKYLEDCPEQNGPHPDHYTFL